MQMVKCWDLETNKVIRHYHGHLSGVYSLACVTISCSLARSGPAVDFNTYSLHPTLDVLITAGRDASARVWDMRTKAQVHVLTGHTATISDVKAQESDPQVITGSMDSTVRCVRSAASARSGLSLRRSDTDYGCRRTGFGTSQLAKQ